MRLLAIFEDRQTTWSNLQYYLAPLPLCTQSRFFTTSPFTDTLSVDVIVALRLCQACKFFG